MRPTGSKLERLLRQTTKRHDAEILPFFAERFPKSTEERARLLRERDEGRFKLRESAFDERIVLDSARLAARVLLLPVRFHRAARVELQRPSRNTSTSLFVALLLQKELDRADFRRTRDETRLHSTRRLLCRAARPQRRADRRQFPRLKRIEDDEITRRVRRADARDVERKTHRLVDFQIENAIQLDRVTWFRLRRENADPFARRSAFMTRPRSFLGARVEPLPRSTSAPTTRRFALRDPEAQVRNTPLRAPPQGKAPRSRAPREPNHFPNRSETIPRSRR